MSTIEVLSRTQKIIVESPSSVSIINAGPIGPGGPQGIQGEEGPQGEQGIQGIQGVPGSDADATDMVAAEAEFRSIADTALSDRIDDDVSALIAEVAARIDADNGIIANLATETATRISVDAAEVIARNAAIAIEAGSRVIADDALDDRIDTQVAGLSAEITARTAADTTLTTNLAAEATARAAADTTLTTNLAAEVSARAAADTILTTNLATEVAARIAAITTEENARDAAIASLVDSAPGTLNTLNELAAALGDDPNFATSMSTLIGTKADDADLTTEITDRTNAVTALTSAVALKANDADVVKLTGAQSVAGIKTFTDVPVVPVDSFAQNRIVNLIADLASKATDAAVVHLAGVETLTGAKTFSQPITLVDATLSRSAAGRLEASGVFKASALQSGYLIDLTEAAPFLDLNSTVPGSISVLNRTDTFNVPLRVRGMAGQVGQLQRWENSAGTALTLVDPYGQIGTLYLSDITLNGPYLNLAADGMNIVDRGAQGAATMFGIAGGASRTGAIFLATSLSTTAITLMASSAGQAMYLYTGKGDPPSANLDTGSVVLHSLKAAGLGVGPSIQFAGKTGNGAVDYLLGSIQVYKASVSVNDYSGGMRFGVTSAAGGNNVLMYIDSTLGSAIVSPIPNASALIVRGATGQFADIQRWEDSAGTMYAKMTAGGYFYTISGGGIVTSYIMDAAAVGPYVALTTGAISVINRVTASNVPFIVQGMAAQTGDLQRWTDSTGSVLAKLDYSGAMRAGEFIGAYVEPVNGTGPYLSLNGSSVIVINRATVEQIPLIIRGMAGQTGNLQTWEDSTQAVMASMSSAGSLILASGVGNLFGSVVGNYHQAANLAGVYIDLATVAGSVSIINRSTVGAVPLRVRGMAGQTGKLQTWESSAGAEYLSVSAYGTLGFPSSSVQTTVGAAGPAAALPATPTKYILVTVAGTVLVIPAYAAS